MSTRATSPLLGLVGDGVTPSLTPPLHEAEARHHGLTLLYRPIDLTVLGIPADRVGDVLRWAHVLGFNGLNVTHPCKQLVLAHLDEVDPDAARLEAVNTVTIDDAGRTVGHNTDHSGFRRGFQEGLPGAAVDRVVQLGAGGAGSAVAYALLTLGAQQLTVVDVDRSRAQARAEGLARLFPDRTVAAGTPADLPGLLARADGLVNCTPVGMAAHPGLPLDAELLDDRFWVSDIVYRPLATALLTTAAARGCRTLSGAGMAVGQAVDAFAVFTGRTADPARMHDVFASLVDAEQAAP
ncbi:shikimate dehydrogenase [Tersicoccus sp. Bi-70]|uniref:shikimate dehydrogenase n=1 Tax=Tersicoccus sp. Bi-70 TaxID=1897634 RepID=UPI0009755389|nr:shikimate dehydrogenase [Tersicoccus sp. Bi-70]OMH35234.1 shikimate dehydrogenase [Tersicoccus sp. Bi-70]